MTLYRLDCKIPAHAITRHLGECFVEVYAERVVLCAACDTPLGGLGDCPLYPTHSGTAVVWQVDDDE